MNTPEVEMARGFVPAEIIEYAANSVASRTIYKKPSGSMTILAFDAGIERTEKSSPFDTIAQNIEGTVEVVINGIPQILHTGMVIIIPAHTSTTIKGTSRSKIILTVIKSGYEG